MKQLITDFDGVLCDSATEGHLTAHNAFHRLQDPDYPRLLDIEEIPAEQRQEFHRLRAYLHGAEDFIPILQAVLKGVPIRSQQDFEVYRRTMQDRLEECQQAFYAERDYMRFNERERWLQLNPLFPRIMEAFRSLAPFDDVYILTTKRSADVLDILEFNGIDFPPDHINDVNPAEKYPRMHAISAASGVESAECAYIEDQVSFLPPAAESGYQVYLASWGYVSDEQRSLADSEGIRIIDEYFFTSLVSPLLK